MEFLINRKDLRPMAQVLLNLGFEANTIAF
jgi:hypothetical protein